MGCGVGWGGVGWGGVDGQYLLVLFHFVAKCNH